jgi:DNA-binding transcriptional regulator LsrR (DeoR family)
MNDLRTKEREFARLILSGKYQQKEICQMIGISRRSASRWIKQMNFGKLLKVQNNLTNELLRLSKDCSQNKETISNLISDIERIQKLIKQQIDN